MATTINTTSIVYNDATADTSGGLATTSVTGYTKLPNGLYVQWGGNASMSSDTNTTITFPVAFPNAVLSIIFGPAYQTSTVALYPTVISTELSSFVVRINSTDSGVGGYYIAIGY
jgi:hypothetical protein